MTHPPIKLTLYVVENSATSSIAIHHLHRAFERLTARNFEVEMVNVSESPMRALRARVLVTPTLVVNERAGRVVGDLSDPDLLDYFLRSISEGD